jgi:hypothetical protein
MKASSGPCVVMLAVGLVGSSLASCVPEVSDGNGDDDSCIGASCPASLGSISQGGSSGTAGSGGGRTGNGGTTSTATPCLEGIWETPACGGDKSQTLTFTSDSQGAFTNPECTGICNDMVFPYRYDLSGSSVTLFYGVPGEVTCDGFSGPPRPPQPKNDTFSFTCSPTQLVTTTSSGSVTYHRVGNAPGGSGGSGSMGGSGGSGSLGGSGGSGTSVGDSSIGYWTNGAWHGHLYTVSAGSNSTIERTGLCARGSVSADASFQSNALWGWNISQTEGSPAADRWSPTTNSVHYDISPSLGEPLQLNIITGTGQVWCTRPSTSVGNVLLTDFNTTCWDGQGEFYDGVTPLQGIQVLVLSNDSHAQPFDFCVNDLSPR